MKMRDYNGNLIDPLNPKGITIEGIARTLSRIPRFGGHSYHVLSVARHSINVSDGTRAKAKQRRKADHPIAALYGLMHDAHEAYIGDIPTPVVTELAIVPEIGGAKFWLDDQIFTALVPEAARERFPGLHKHVKAADIAALREEMGWLWSEDIAYTHSAKDDEATFLSYYHRLIREIGA